MFFYIEKEINIYFTCFNNDINISQYITNDVNGNDGYKFHVTAC